MPRWTFVEGLDAMGFDFTAGTFRAMLIDTTWTPDPSVDRFVDDISAMETAAVGYSRQTLTGETISYQLPGTASAPGYIVYDCDDIGFGTLSGGVNVGFVVVYYEDGGDSTSPLVCALTIAYTADGTVDCVVVVSPNGLLRTSTLCDNGDFDAAPTEGS